MDAHTAHSLWWRAGDYLLDRVTPAGYDPLRLLETPALLRQRAVLTRTVSQRLIPTVVCGDPHAIAATIIHTFPERNEGW